MRLADTVTSCRQKGKRTDGAFQSSSRIPRIKMKCDILLTVSVRVLMSQVWTTSSETAFIQRSQRGRRENPGRDDLKLRQHSPLPIIQRQQSQYIVCYIHSRRATTKTHYSEKASTVTSSARKSGSTFPGRSGSPLAK